jgi:aryl-alcohol dehydrogenase-like predicted oxidoreductase
VLYTQLAPGLPPSSALGFGCAGLAGRVGPRQSSRAIAAALAAGVTHFDVARAYGYGEAEAILGENLRGRRDKVVIATKFGIEPPRAASALRFVKPLAQIAVSFLPRLRQIARHTIATSTTGGHFSVKAARASVEMSLRKLNTDYIDILLLHDAAPRDVTDALIRFLDGLVEQGKVRVYGAAGSVDHTIEIQRAWPSVSQRQFASNILCPVHLKIAGDARPSLLHSPFRDADKLMALIRSKRSEMTDLGLAGITAREGHRLMLAYLIATNPVGVTLCSMLGEGRVQENIAVVEKPALSRQQIEGITALVENSEKRQIAEPQLL